MAMTQAKLESMLSSPPVITEAEAIDALAVGFMDFFLDTTVSGYPASAAALAGADAAFRAALVGMSASGAGAMAIQSAVTAFWAAAMAAAPTVWVTVPVIVPGTGLPPPGLPTIAAGIATAGAANLAASASLSVAAAAIASVLLTAQAGATVTLSPPPVGGTPLVPVL